MVRKKTPVKLVSKSEQKIFENSEIGPDSETLTSCTRELVDSNFNQLSFIHSLVIEGFPLRKRGYRGEGGEPPLLPKNMTNFFLLRFCWKFKQTSFPKFQTLSEVFEEKKMQSYFFHDFKCLMNFLSILKKKKLFEIFQKCLPFQSLTFFGKV